MNHIIGQMIFGLPLLVESFTKGYAIIPAFICALVLASGKLRLRTKLVISVAALFLAALYVASFDPAIVVALMILMLPAVTVLTVVFSGVFRLLRVVGGKYDSFLDGRSNA